MAGDGTALTLRRTGLPFAGVLFLGGLVMRLAGTVSLVALSLTGCGAPALSLPDAGGEFHPDPSDGGMTEGAIEDAGLGCTSDSECAKGLVCVRSTGDCVLSELPPVDMPDAGHQPACNEGESITCGASKIGECRLGVSTCTDGGFGACVGSVGPTAELCNGKDDDCDGLIDEDQADIACGLGECRRVQASCVDGAPMACVPGTPAAEICNGKDDDCDGTVDDGLGNLNCGVGACARTVAACVMGQPQMCLPGMPSTETCNGIDDDCNGMTDENLGSTTCGTGACQRTTVNCVGGTPNTCTPGAPSHEVCNGIDDNCNGLVDDGLGNVSCGVGACRRTVAACTNGVANSCTPGPPMTETCNNVDDDCDGTVDNGVCGPTGMCPQSSTVAPNSTVTLTTMASSPAGRGLSCQWTVVSRPATSSGTFSAPTSCASSTYFADVVGVHTLKFTATDSMGLTTTCTVTITVNALGALWVEATWNRNDDVDLHLQHPMAGNSHNANGWSFNAGSYDCFYADLTPSWDAPGTADDPSLDRDDTTGKGPENIRIDVPSTAHDYTIGVHWFSQVATTNNVTATVKVYCNNVLTTTQSHLYGTASAVKDMWVVGKVRFAAAGGCTFTPDGFVFTMP
jgi:hypothetical protein